MIGTICGTIKTVENQKIVIEIGPIGLECMVPTSLSFQPGSIVSLYTYLHWNQEQGPTLFGFSTPLEKTAFLLAISCSGIGPKVGLAILADLGAHSFLQAVQTHDEQLLSQVNGIGEKKAEQIIVQLKHKVANLTFATETQENVSWQTVAQALEALAYSKAEIARAMYHLKNNSNVQNATFDQLIRQALSFLAK
jgi:Holliday junction DNA helicase RuvA